MTTAQVVETSVTVKSNSHTQDYVHLDDQTQPILEIPLSSSESLLLRASDLSAVGSELEFRIVFWVLPGV